MDLKYKKVLQNTLLSATWREFAKRMTSQNAVGYWDDSRPPYADESREPFALANRILTSRDTSEMPIRHKDAFNDYFEALLQKKEVAAT